MTNFNARVALVTGAGRGIGKTTALLLASRGARVMATARTEAELSATGLEYVVADLSTVEGCEAAVSETERRLGPVEVLVCNHGLGSAHEQVLWKQPIDLWRKTMDINLDGPFYLTRSVMRQMVQQRYGRIVYVSSTAGLVAEHAGSAYNASKSGLLGLMRSAAIDGAEFGITANAVLPGWVRTEMAERSAHAESAARGISIDDIWRERDSGYPQGRVVTQDEVAAMIAFLCSDESSGVNGESIKVALGAVA